METDDWQSWVLKKAVKYLPTRYLLKRFSWRWLRFYPVNAPSIFYFNEWNRAEKGDDWRHYQDWINRKSLRSVDDWSILQKRAYQWHNPPKISIITPVYNTDIHVLFGCIDSVCKQSYPYWQLILVDDYSSKGETYDFLKALVGKDPRIDIVFCSKPQGISNATNIALSEAKGDYVAFLDHDDLLTLDALFMLAVEIQGHPEVDIIYSDRDMLSPQGRRYLHLFKPSWSPETLYSGNYVFHLMCYRKSLLNELGGFRAELDGSQDYDLILRAMETSPVVRHIQKILYHWRQYGSSVALDSDSKAYAFRAGVEALNQAMQRRGIKGYASEIKSLWRGNYQLNLRLPELQNIKVVTLHKALSPDQYRQYVNQHVKESIEPFIAILSDELTEEGVGQGLSQLAAWVKMDNVGLASGCMTTTAGVFDYAGATYAKDGAFLAGYQGFSQTEEGYMAVTQIVRNISAPHPFCVVINRECWQQLNGLRVEFDGFYALLDFALRALAKEWRSVYVPQAKFLTDKPISLTAYPDKDKPLFVKKWQLWLELGDPYYNRHFNNERQDRVYHLI